MADDPRIALALAEAAKLNQQFGHKTAFVGKNPYATTSVPSGSLMYDYMSGLGGHPRNAPVEIFGPPSIGKTSMFGYSVIRNAQAMGLLTGIICTEPSYEDYWVEKNGINPDFNVVAYPDNIDEGFEIYHKWIFDGTIDYILFDSLVGSATESDMEEGKVARPGGLAKTITWNLQRTVMRQAKNNIGSMFINQIRDDQKAHIPGLVMAPGGHALKHLAMVRVQLKPGKTRYTMKVPGGDGKPMDKMVGREMVAVFAKAKAHDALNNKANFDYFWVDTDGEYPFGIDVAQDVINTAKVAKVFEPNGAWLKHPLFPGGKLNGKAAVGKWIAENPDKLEQIRLEVLDAMVAHKIQKPELKAVK